MARVAVNTISTQIRNHIINSNFDYWQRNTSFATPSTGTYNADRWRVDYNGTSGTFTISRQAFTLGQTNVPGEPKFFIRWNQTVASSGSTDRLLQQLVEGVRTLAGKNVTVSFWAKADASRTLGVQLEQFFGSGGSPSGLVTLATQNASLTTAWQKFSFTFIVPSISGKTLGTNNNDYTNVAFRMPLNVVNTIDISQVMVNDGSSPANFKLAGEGLPEELVLCQRYYEKSYDHDVVPGTAGITAGTTRGGTLSSQSGVAADYKATKRAVPSITFYNPATGATGTWREDAGADRTATTLGNGLHRLSVSWPAGATVGIGGHWVSDAEL